MVRKKQYEVLQWAFSFLKQYHREEKVAELLLQHHLKLSRSKFFTMMQEEVPESIYEIFINDVKKHALTGIPVQHLTGYEYFYGRRFHVNHHVLVPRFETEELVRHVVDLVKKNYNYKPLTIVDAGTGSGVIAISLALELPDITVYATDISKEALQVARYNASVLEADVQFFQGDFIEPLIKNKLNAHILVSNPPYIKKVDRHLLADTVKDFDPALALFADCHGLAAYQTIISQTKQLENVRNVCFEIGYDQAMEVTSILKQQYPSSIVRTIQDINGKDRIISAQI